MQFKPHHEVTTKTYVVTHHVDAGQLGKRLDHFLKERHRSRSRIAIQRAISEGLISIDRHQSEHLQVGKPKPSTLLIPGDVVKVLTHRKTEPLVSFDYQILFQDPSLVIVDKPAQLPVHPAGRYFFNTLLIHLRTEGHRKLEISSNKEFFLPHRIDKETSGVLILTRTQESCADVVAQFAQRKTKKTYLAIVHGTPFDQTFEISAAVHRDPFSLIGLKMMTQKSEAESHGNSLVKSKITKGTKRSTSPRNNEPQIEWQNAETHFKVLKTFKNYFGVFSLLECTPFTGRQHQIRIHLEHAGFPIVGDKLYGMDERMSLQFYERRHLTPESQAKLILPRHALHAWKLEFTHPVTKKLQLIEAPIPKDFAAFMEDQTGGTRTSWNDLSLTSGDAFELGDGSTDMTGGLEMNSED